jgi:hypothetical protein
MKYYEIYPEVAGKIHEDCIIDVAARPIKISGMHYEFDGWLGDDLLTEAGYFILSEQLGKAMESAKLTGYEILDCKVSKSNQFKDIYPSRILPIFKWLKINGDFPKDDFWFSKETMMLNVSEDVLNVLNQFQISNCEIEETDKEKLY